MKQDIDVDLDIKIQSWVRMLNKKFHHHRQMVVNKNLEELVSKIFRKQPPLENNSSNCLASTNILPKSVTSEKVTTQPAINKMTDENYSTSPEKSK